MYALRSRLSESLATAVPEPQAALGQALLLGLRTGISDEVLDEFRATGASHILAISGLHVGVLMGLSPNPPKDTDGRREDGGRGWVRELQGRWPGVLGQMGGRRTVFSRRTGP